MEPTPPSIITVGRLNGIIWFSIVLLLLAVVISRSENALRYLVLLVCVAGVGALVNLGLWLWKYATDRDRARPYLLAAIPLASLGGWLWYGFTHLSKSW
jgi:uncharacterized membrane protein YfcA